MGHNLYGEPAWPNNILYIFLAIILGISKISFGLSFSFPYYMSDAANPFATPLEILPEWYFLSTFNLLRILPSKVLGVLSMVSLPLILGIVTFGENLNKFQNPFRRPVESCTLIKF